MIRGLLLGLLVSGMAGMVSGCAAFHEVRPAPAAENAENAENAEIALSRQLLEAFIKDDAEGFVALLPAEMQERFTVENFKATRKNVTEAMGEPVEFSYVTCLELPSIHPHIWKVRFRRTNLPKTKEFTSEVLFKVLTGSDKAGEPLIVGFQFI